MAVKTITIDMEAYDLLSAEKKQNESFSRVIKRYFRKGRTAEDLLARLDQVCLSEETLRHTDALVKARKQSPARSRKL